MKTVKYLIWSIFVINHSILAQVSSSLEVNSAFDDNVFRSPEPTEDFISNLDIDLGYRFNNTNLQILYNGNFIFYRNLKERNLSLHQFGINYYLSFGKDNLHISRINQMKNNKNNKRNNAVNRKIFPHIPYILTLYRQSVQGFFCLRILFLQ